MSWQDGFTFLLTEQEVLIQESVRSFSQNRLAPHALEIDAQKKIPATLKQEMADLGLFGLITPPQFGGGGVSYVAYALAIEELAAACASSAIMISAHSSLCCYPLELIANQSLKEHFLNDLASGTKIGCFALSEPSTGSDASAIATTAEKVANGYIINGTKNWITNGESAGVCILFAKLKNCVNSGNKNIVAFAHDMSLSGIVRGRGEDKLGIRGSETCSISYNNVFLADDSLIASVDDGFSLAMQTLDGGRIGVAAQAVGIARAAFALALKYSQERQTFGKPLYKHQTISNYLAEMITKIDAARFLVISAAKLKDAKQDFSRQAAMAKLFSSEISSEVCDLALQIHGGYGYVRDYQVERLYRDARITRIYEGTSEIQKLVIANKLLTN
jgi:alkylation response protein AidB-like acyl-CoA dehydrogenase